MLVAATEIGVIAPKVKVMAGVVVAVATVPLTPFAGTTETDVTLPLPLLLNVFQSVELNEPVADVLASPRDNAWPAKLNPFAVPIVTSPELVPVTGAAHVPSPLQKVEDEADVPLPRFVTAKLPVTPLAKSI